MKKILGWFKTYLFYVLLAVVVTIAAAFVPFLNPIVSYESGNTHMLASIFSDLGQIEKYFESVLSSFSVFGNILFMVMLLFYVGMISYICGLILVLGEGQGGKRSIFIGSLVFILVYLVLFVIYYSINLELFLNGSELITSKFQVWLKIPVGIYFHFVLAVITAVLSILGSGIDFKAVWYGMRLNLVHRFNGGVYPTPHKNTRSKPIETLPPQKEMIFPLLQHVGEVCTPCVAVGDYVRVGQKIADSTAEVSVPVHSTVSGTVVDIREWDHPSGNKIPAILIENDFEDNRADCFHEACPDYRSKTPEELIGIIREAGVVGMGGAAFPTHLKLLSALGRIDTLIVNAAECESYLSSDHRIILEATDDLVGGMEIVRYILGANHVFIGIQNNKPDAISALHKKLHKSKNKVVILKSKYPQGGEKQLIRAVTGRAVPSGKLPVDVGCLVLNVDTVIAIYRAVVNGAPLMRRIVTVAGHGVEKTGNLNVRIGTPFSAVLNHFGFNPATKKIIMGGPMMGEAQKSLDAPVIKSTSALICMTKEQLTVDRDVNCIRCGSCVSSCPMYLLPNYIANYVKEDKLDLLEKYHLTDCIECGCCSFTCPVKIPLIHYMRLGKEKLRSVQNDDGGDEE